MNAYYYHPEFSSPPYGAVYYSIVLGAIDLRDPHTEFLVRMLKVRLS